MAEYNIAVDRGTDKFLGVKVIRICCVIRSNMILFNMSVVLKKEKEIKRKIEVYKSNIEKHKKRRKIQ